MRILEYTKIKYVYMYVMGMGSKINTKKIKSPDCKRETDLKFGGWFDTQKNPMEGHPTPGT